MRPRIPSGFNPLSTGHAHGRFNFWNFECFSFQSPIYGSRTVKIEVFEKPEAGFNPLSTGHARGTEKAKHSRLMGFNPLSTGHALWFHRCAQAAEYVSIPYLRVTHKAETGGG